MPVEAGARPYPSGQKTVIGAVDSRGTLSSARGWWQQPQHGECGSVGLWARRFFVVALHVRLLFTAVVCDTAKGWNQPVCASAGCLAQLESTHPIM